MAEDISSFGIKIDTTDVLKASKNLEKLAESGKKAETASLALEKEFKKLNDTAKGILAAVEKQAKSYEELARAANKAVGEIDKVEKSVTKTSSTLEKSSVTASNWGRNLGRAAGVAATAMAGLAIQSARMADDYDRLGNALQAMARNLGISNAAVEQAELAMRSQGASLRESRTAVLDLVKANIDLSKSSELATIASNAAAVSGKSFTESMDLLVRSIRSGSSEQLRALGINVRLRDELKLLSQQTGKNIRDFNDAERRQAMLNAVLREGTRVMGAASNQAGTMKKSFNNLTDAVEDLMTMFGQVFKPSLVVAIQAVTRALDNTANAADELTKDNQLEVWGEQVAMKFVGIAVAVETAILKFKEFDLERELLFKNFETKSKEGVGGLSSFPQLGLFSLGSIFTGQNPNDPFGGKKAAGDLSRSREEILRELEKTREKIKNAGSELRNVLQEYLIIKNTPRPEGAGGGGDDDGFGSGVIDLDARRRELQQFKDLIRQYLDDLKHKFELERVWTKQAMDEAEAFREQGLLNEYDFAKRRNELILSEHDKLILQLQQRADTLSAAMTMTNDADTRRQLENDLTETNQAIEKAMKERENIVLNNQRRIDKIMSERSKGAQAIHDQAQALEDETAKIQAENQQLKIGAVLHEQMTELYFTETVAIAENTLKRKEANKASEYEIKLAKEQVEAAQRALSAYRDNRRAQGENKILKDAQDAQKAWKDAAQNIEDYLVRAFSGGTDNARSMFKRLIDDIKAWFARLVLRPIVQPIMGALGGFFGVDLSQMGGVAGSMMGGGGAAGAAGGGGFFGTASNAYQAYQAYKTGGFFAGAGTYVAGAGQALGSPWLTNFGVGMQGGAVSQAGAAAPGYGAGSAFAGGASIAGGALIGHYGGRLVSGGYSASGSSGNRAVNTGTVIGGIIGSIIPGLGTAVGAAVGGVLGGLVNRLFGRKPKQLQRTDYSLHTDTRNDFATGTETDVYRAKGGLFRRDKWSRETQNMDAGFLAQFNRDVKEMEKVIKGAAREIGGLKEFGSIWVRLGFSVKHTGDAAKDAAEFEKAYAAEMEKAGGKIGEELIPNLKDFQRGNESLLDTFVRLGEVFKVTNDLALMMGKSQEQVWGAVGMAGVKAREALVDAAGGVEEFAKYAQVYFRNLSPERQLAYGKAQVAKMRKDMEQEFGAVGISTNASRQQLMAYADSLDLTTERGRKLWLATMELLDAQEKVEAQERELANVMRQRAHDAALWMAAVKNIKLPNISNEALSNAGIDPNQKGAAANAFTAAVYGPVDAAIQGVEALNGVLGTSITTVDGLKTTFQAASDAAARGAPWGQKLAAGLLAVGPAMAQALRTLDEAVAQSEANVKQAEQGVKQAQQAVDDAHKRVADAHRNLAKIHENWARRQRQNELRDLQESLQEQRRARQRSLQLARREEDQALMLARRQRDRDLQLRQRAEEKAREEWWRNHEKLMQGLQEKLSKAEESLNKARSDLSDAYNRESAALTQTKDKFEQFAKSLRDLRSNLLLDKGLSPLTPLEQYGETKRQIDSLIPLAQSGDADAQAKLQALIPQWLEASRGLYASSDRYEQDFNYAQSLLEALAAHGDSQVVAFQSQLEALNKLVGEHMPELIKKEVELQDAVKAFQEAQLAADAARAEVESAERLAEEQREKERLEEDRQWWENFWREENDFWIDFERENKRFWEDWAEEDRQYQEDKEIREIQRAEEEAQAWQDYQEAVQAGQDAILEAERGVQNALENLVAAQDTLADAQRRHTELLAKLDQLRGSMQVDQVNNARNNAINAFSNLLANPEYRAARRRNDTVRMLQMAEEVVRPMYVPGGPGHPVNRAVGEVFGRHVNYYNPSYNPNAPMFARGYERVPFDGFPAILHEGERVLTRSAAEAYDASRGRASEEYGKLMQRMGAPGFANGLRRSYGTQSVLLHEGEKVISELEAAVVDMLKRLSPQSLPLTAYNRGGQVFGSNAQLAIHQLWKGMTPSKLTGMDVVNKPGVPYKPSGSQNHWFYKPGQKPYEDYMPPPYRPTWSDQKPSLGSKLTPEVAELLMQIVEKLDANSAQAREIAREMIKAEFEAAMKAADRIVDGQRETVTIASWRERSKPTLS